MGAYKMMCAYTVVRETLAPTSIIAVDSMAFSRNQLQVPLV
jgi:hypothetical protein